MLYVPARLCKKLRHSVTVRLQAGELCSTLHLMGVAAWKVPVLPPPTPTHTRCSIIIVKHIHRKLHLDFPQLIPWDPPWVCTAIKIRGCIHNGKNAPYGICMYMQYCATPPPTPLVVGSALKLYGVIEGEKSCG